MAERAGAAEAVGHFPICRAAAGRFRRRSPSVRAASDRMGTGPPPFLAPRVHARCTGWRGREDPGTTETSRRTPRCRGTGRRPRTGGGRGPPAPGRGMQGDRAAKGRGIASLAPRGDGIAASSLPRRERCRWRPAPQASGAGEWPVMAAGRPRKGPANRSIRVRRKRLDGDPGGPPPDQNPSLIVRWLCRCGSPPPCRWVSATSSTGTRDRLPWRIPRSAKRPCA